MEEALNELPDLSQVAYTDEYIIKSIGEGLTCSMRRGCPSIKHPWELNFQKKISEEHMVGLMDKVVEHYKKKGIHLDVGHECKDKVFTILVKNIQTTAEIKN